VAVEVEAIVGPEPERRAQPLKIRAHAGTQFLGHRHIAYPDAIHALKVLVERARMEEVKPHVGNGDEGPPPAGAGVLATSGPDSAGPRERQQHAAHHRRRISGTY